MLRFVELAIGVALGVLWARERQARKRAERYAAAGLESLLRAIDANDPQTGAHVRRVATYALIIADELGVDDNERCIIELTGLFHDIGKIHEALFDLVHEPRSLTSAERQSIHTHPARGADVLAPIAQFHPRLTHAVLAHHEHWNGQGYPRRLTQRRIPLAARVVAIADTFDVVTYGRRYRGGRTVDEAVRVLEEGRATQFDPEIIDLVLLPPVLDRLTAAMEKAYRADECVPSRSPRSEGGRAPRIRIRWQTRTDPPAVVRKELRRARSLSRS